MVQSLKTLDSKIHYCLERLDDLLFDKFDSESNGLLSGGGGVALYFKYRLLQTGQPLFLDKVMEILEKEVEKTNMNPIEPYLSIGSSSISSVWLYRSTYINEITG